MRSITLYLPEDLVSRLQAAADADGRSLSNYVSRQLDGMLCSEPLSVDVRPGRAPHQVDIEELSGAIARRVAGGPQRAGRQRRGRKP
jgi:hypothetical protein